MLEPWSFSQIKKVSYCDQNLIFKSNAQLRPFSLLRVEWSHGALGYSCLSPMAHLKDPSLQDLRNDLLRNIKSGGEGISSFQAKNVSEVLLKSLDFNYGFQGLLRTIDENFFELAKIRHNFLITDIESLREDEIRSAQQMGFESFKVKLQPAHLDAFFKKLKIIKNFEILLRLDFNSCLTAQQYFHFVDRFDKEFLQVERSAQIEYIEDPCSLPEIQQFPFDKDLLFQVPVFLDNEWALLGRELHPVVKGLVLKPAVRKLEQPLAVAKFLKLDLRFTSYMDHDLGVLQALAEIFRLSTGEVKNSLRKENQGFLTGDLFESFQGQIFRSTGPYLELNGDYKSTLQKYFEALPWVNIL